MSGNEASGLLAAIGFAFAFASLMLPQEQRTWAKRLLIVALVFFLPALSRLWIAAILN